jgi:hypothetical protein
MRTEIRFRWQGAKCVEAPPGRGLRCLPLVKRQVIMG